MDGDGDGVGSAEIAIAATGVILGVGIEDFAPETLAREADVDGVAEEMPIEALLVIPFAPLAEFASHEEKFFSGLGEHVTEKEPDVGKPLPLIAGHFAEEGAFSVDDFIVRDGKDKIFREG